MKLERSKDWWMARARREGDAVIGAGLRAFKQAGVPVGETRIAFGKFVSLMCRN